MGRVREAAASPDRLLRLLEQYDRRVADLERRIHELSFPEVPRFTSLRDAGAAIDLQRKGERFILYPPSDSSGWGSGVDVAEMHCLVAENSGGTTGIYPVSNGPTAFFGSAGNTNLTTTSSTPVHISGSEISMPDGIGFMVGWLWAGMQQIRGLNGGSGNRSDGDVGFYLQNIGTYYPTGLFHLLEANYIGYPAGGWFQGGDFSWSKSDGAIRHGVRRTWEGNSADYTYAYGPQLAYYPFYFTPS